MDVPEQRKGGLRFKTKVKNARLFIISAPSGAGKTTLITAVRKHFPNMLYSISYTTRKPRGKEKGGTDYFFISVQRFKKKIKEGDWAEWAKVHDNYYGTSASFINDGLSKGYDILLDIDIKGTAQILKKFPDGISIFIMPPSYETLYSRLKNRGTDSDKEIEKRIKNAKEEIKMKHLYHHLIVNDHLKDAVESIVSIIDSYQDNN